MRISAVVAQSTPLSLSPHTLQVVLDSNQEHHLPYKPSRGLEPWAQGTTCKTINDGTKCFNCENAQRKKRCWRTMCEEQLQKEVVDRCRISGPLLGWRPKDVCKVSP